MECQYSISSSLIHLTLRIQKEKTKSNIPPDAIVIASFESSLTSYTVISLQLYWCIILTNSAHLNVYKPTFIINNSFQPG